MESITTEPWFPHTIYQLNFLYLYLCMLRMYVLLLTNFIQTYSIHTPLPIVDIIRNVINICGYHQIIFIWIFWDISTH